MNDHHARFVHCVKFCTATPSRYSVKYFQMIRTVWPGYVFSLAVAKQHGEQRKRIRDCVQIKRQQFQHLF